MLGTSVNNDQEYVQNTHVSDQASPDLIHRIAVFRYQLILKLNKLYVDPEIMVFPNDNRNGIKN